jgi:hypothetical protein
MGKVGNRAETQKLLAAFCNFTTIADKLVAQYGIEYQ